MAAVAATRGASLLVMAAEITGASAADRDEADAWLVEARSVLAVLSSHADRDVLVFERYMAALVLPRATDEERSARKVALGEAALAAAEAPLAAGNDMARAIELGARLARFTKKSVASDVLAGGDLLGGAVVAVLRNVDANLGAAPAGERARLERARDELLARASAANEDLRSALRGR